LKETHTESVLESPKNHSFDCEKSLIKSNPYNICFPSISTEDFLQRIHISKQQYNFYSSNEPEEKAQRMSCLKELYEMMDNESFSVMINANIGPLMEMIKCNIIRPLPPKSKVVRTTISTNPEEATVNKASDKYFSQIKIVYMIFLRLLSIAEHNMSEYLTSRLISELVNLLNSHIKKERTLVSDVLLLIYEKFVNKRKFIRKTMIHCFEGIIYDDPEFQGINELLDFYSLVIKGFAIPLKQSNIDFFQRILIPLHKHEHVYNFFQSLKNCCYIYIAKDSHLANQLIEHLVKYMPFGHSAKEELFLLEIKEILHNIDSKIIERQIFIKLCKRLVRSIKDSSFLIAIKSISLINIDSFLELLNVNRSEVLKSFYHVLDKLFQCDVDDEYYDILTLTEFNLSKLHQEAYESYLKKKDDGESEAKKDNNEKWAVFGELAKEKCMGFVSPAIPYDENVSLTNYSQTYQRFANKIA